MLMPHVRPLCSIYVVTHNVENRVFFSKPFPFQRPSHIAPLKTHSTHTQNAAPSIAHRDPFFIHEVGYIIRSGGVRSKLRLAAPGTMKKKNVCVFFYYLATPPFVWPLRLEPTTHIARARIVQVIIISSGSAVARDMCVCVLSAHRAHITYGECAMTMSRRTPCIFHKAPYIFFSISIQTR